MDTPDLEEKLIVAGREFNLALEKLGLDADAVFWGFDHALSHHVLVVITDFFDAKGPLEISKQLFKAYNASATPREIDPFVVRLHSINQAASPQFLSMVRGGMFFQNVDDATGRPFGPKTSIMGMNIAGIDVQTKWVIKAKAPKKRPLVEINRRWERFAKNVEDKAAA